MGTLSPPFILCPLSDRKELMGMSEDKLNNKVIVTIGRNIAIRYHVSERRLSACRNSKRDLVHTYRCVYFIMGRFWNRSKSGAGR
jgi:G:T-mismatch repair DNA endonuclease (very short patch repair protein)